MALEVTLPRAAGPSTWISTEKLVKRSNGLLRVSEICTDKRKLQMSVSTKLPMRKMSSPVLDVSCSYNNYPASVLKSGGCPASLDDSLILKDKSQKISPYLNGRCIYLVGMMGSGKTTVGRILAEVLGYSFFDSDVLVENAVGGLPVAEIFKLYGEGYFRDSETEVLRNLSSMQQLVVSTGGGAVIRPINWKYMRSGISVWLDVPLEALARRIAAVGTNSRPLLNEGAGDEYSKAFTRLSTLMDERGEAYGNSNARVSLESIAAKLGCRDVSTLSPAVIAIEVLEQIEHFLREDGFAI